MKKREKNLLKNPQKKKQGKKYVYLLIGLLLVLGGILFFVYSNLNREYFGVVDESKLSRVLIDEIPKDTLYITEERRYYPRGEMTLIIPSIDVYTQIGESTEPEGLKEMPGLYEFSQLPGEGDVNVSVAGHRDIHGKEFYSLDKVTDGDCAYLIYGGNVYRYIYRDTKIVKPDDWSVIKPQGMSCLTLTTCDPIGTTLNRLIARFELMDYQAYGEQYEFKANTQ